MKKILIVFVTAILLVCAGCDQATNIQNNDEPININDIQVPEDFTYQTSSAVAVNLTVTDALDNPVQGIIFKIYDADPDQNGRFISKGGTLEDGSYETALIVPEGCNELTVVSPMNTLSVPIINGELNYEYEGYTYLHPDTNDPSIKSGNIINNELPGNRNDSKTNLVTNGDFEIDDFGSMGYVWDPFMPSDGRWYFSQDHGSLDWLNDGGNHVVLSPWSYPDNNFNGSACQLIDAEPGDNFTLSVDVKYIGNNLENTFLIGIQGRDSSGVSIWSYSNHYQISASWTTWTSLWDIFYSGSLSVSAISVYFNIGDQNTDGSLYVDNFVVTKLGDDTDGDGVPDDEDDYPDDADRAFDNFFPAEDVFSTLAFEDKWPRKSDYDFNDIVIDWNYTQVTNASNELVDIIGSFKLRAIGAGYHNGCGVQFPFAISNYSDFDDNGLTHQYVDNGTTNAVVILFEDAFDPYAGTRW